MALQLTKEILEGKKLSFNEIEDMVVKNGFGLEPFTHKGVACAMSHGIHYALLSKGLPIAEVEAALDRFLAGDFGSFYAHDEAPTPGREYGCYPSAYGSDPDAGAIMVHREPSNMVPWDLVVYFQFER